MRLAGWKMAWMKAMQILTDRDVVADDDIEESEPWLSEDDVREASSEGEGNAVLCHQLMTHSWMTINVSLFE